jgi:phosphoglycolate phosphatase-like HAD superfamily hydrolase
MGDARPIVFLDNGGVISNHALMPVEVRRLIGEFFSERLGGDGRTWEAANREVFARTWQEFMGGLHGSAQPFSRFEAAQREYAVAWLQRMYERVGVAAPESREALRLEREAFEFIWPRAEVALPGSAEAVRTIMDAGFALHLASSGVSWELEALMAGLGIGSCFTTY